MSNLLHALVSEGEDILREATVAIDRSSQTDTVHIDQVVDWHRRSASFLSGKNPEIALHLPSLDVSQPFKKIYVAIAQTLALLRSEAAPVRSNPKPIRTNERSRASAQPHGATVHSEHPAFDVAIVCALPQLELEAVRGVGRWEKLAPHPADPQTYYSSSLKSKNGSLIRLVAAAPNQMGLSASGVLAAKIIWRFRPKLVAMVGIAAGSSEDKQGFGDVLVPDQTYDFGAAKTRVKDGALRVSPSPSPIPLRPEVLSRIYEWKTDRRELDAIARGWKAAKPRTSLQVHVGPLFSSPTVLDAKSPVEEQMLSWRKLIGVEMEAHAVHRACHDTTRPPPAFICMKAICDFAENKDDAWQPYAAYTSSSLFFRFLKAEWDQLGLT